MKNQILKIAGCKTDQEFYAKYPTEESFFSKHPEAKQFMQLGGSNAGQTTTTTKHTLADLKDNGFNRTLLDINGLSYPNGYLNALPDQGFFGKIKGIAGGASALAGATLGYSKLFNNKEYSTTTGGSNTLPNSLDYKKQIEDPYKNLIPSDYNVTPNATMPGYNPNTAPQDNGNMINTPIVDNNQFQNNPYGNGFKQSFQPGGEFNPYLEGNWTDYRNNLNKQLTYPNYNLPHYPIIDDRINNDNADIDFSKQLEGVQEDPNAKAIAAYYAAKGMKQQNTAPSTNPINTNNPSNTYTRKDVTHGDRIGEIAALNSVMGLGMANNVLGTTQLEREYRRKLKELGNTDARYMSNNPTNPFGDYTTNVGPGGNFRLSSTTPIQDYTSFEEGGEYEMTEEQIKQYLEEGGEIEYID